jgi:hypothetical protein
MSPTFLEGVGLPITPQTKWGPRPDIRSAMDRRDFQNLKYLGTVPSRTRMSESEVRFRRTENVYNRFSVHSEGLRVLAGDQYQVVIPTRDTVERVMRSWDERAPITFQKSKFYEYSLEYLSRSYRSIFNNPIPSDEQVYEWMDMSTSPGYPASFFGIKSKRECYGDLGYQKFKREFSYSLTEFALHKVTPKVEYLPRESILAPKCRLFVIPELHLLENQLRYGKQTSLNMKNYKWSAYGFNPYMGGTDKLARELLTKPIRFYYDISGWDKFLPVLRDLYSVVEKHNGFSSWSEQDRQRWRWTVDNTVNMVNVMYDGSVYYKTYGNGSGSGTTTRDNILAHIVIMTTILCKAYHDKYGVFPSQQLLDEQIIRLFGDDSICAVDEYFDFVLKENFVSDVFASFGMKLKYFFGGRDYPLDKMEFLGFKFKNIQGRYFPLYDSVKLATSMVYNGVNSNTREAFLSRVFILTFMSYPSEQHSLFKLYARDMAALFSTRRDLTPTEVVMCNMIETMDDEAMQSLFLGEESLSPGILQIFLSGLEVDGIKDVFRTESG